MAGRAQRWNGVSHGRVLPPTRHASTSWRDRRGARSTGQGYLAMGLAPAKPKLLRCCCTRPATTCGASAAASGCEENVASTATKMSQRNSSSTRATPRSGAGSPEQIEKSFRGVGQRNARGAPPWRRPPRALRSDRASPYRQDLARRTRRPARAPLPDRRQRNDARATGCRPRRPDGTEVPPARKTVSRCCRKPEPGCRATSRSAANVFNGMRPRRAAPRGTSRRTSERSSGWMRRPSGGGAGSWTTRARSISPSRSASSSRGPGPSRRWISTPGSSRNSLDSARGSSSRPSASPAPTRSSPAPRAGNPAARSSASISRSNFSASGSRRAPSGVSDMPRAARRNSRVPHARSREATRALMLGWARASQVAARPTAPARATATNARKPATSACGSGTAGLCGETPIR